MVVVLGSTLLTRTCRVRLYVGLSSGYIPWNASSHQHISLKLPKGVKGLTVSPRIVRCQPARFMLLVVVLVVTEMKFEGLELVLPWKGSRIVDGQPRFGHPCFDFRHGSDIQLASRIRKASRATLNVLRRRTRRLPRIRVYGRCFDRELLFLVERSRAEQGCRVSARVRDRGWMAVFDGFRFTCLLDA